MSEERAYQEYLDDETVQFMEKITYAQIVEALNHYVDKSDAEEFLAESVQGRAHYDVGVGLVSICYSYWRKLLDTN